MSKMSYTTTTAGNDLQLLLRPSQTRGNADHGWLNTFHTFSFAMWQDPKWDHFGCLRVLNEDRVAPHEGFGTHAHREFEIFSYVVEGQLQHKDSMGNVEILKRGDVQMTSAGTGIRHSEHSYGEKEVHFLQIWALPNKSGLSPKYYTRHFTDDEKRDVLVPIVAPLSSKLSVQDVRETTGPAPVHSTLAVFASILSPGQEVRHRLQGSKLHVHLIQKSGYNEGEGLKEGARVSVNGVVEMKEGDGVFGEKREGTGAGEGVVEVVLKNEGEKEGEFLVFDIE